MTAKETVTQPQRSAALLVASVSLSALIAASAAAGYEIGKSKPPDIVTVTKEVPAVITEKIPEPFEIKVYYPVASPIARPPPRPLSVCCRCSQYVRISADRSQGRYAYRGQIITVGGILGSGSSAKPPTAAGSLQFSSAQRGGSIPLVYGTTRVAGIQPRGGHQCDRRRYTRGRRYVAASRHHFQCRRQINRAGNPGRTDLDLAL